MGSSGSMVPLFYLLGAAQGVFLALALFSSKVGNRLANRYLGALTLVFAAALIDYWLDYAQLPEPYVRLQTILWPKEFFYGVLLYFYVREMTRPGEFKLQGRQWLHFAPAFIHATITWPILLLSPARQLSILGNYVTSQQPDTTIAFLLSDFELYTAIVQLSLYFILCFRSLSEHQQRIKQIFSYTDKISLDWLRILVIGTFIVYLIWLARELLGSWMQMELIFNILLGASMVVLIYGMGYLGLCQPLIFTSYQASQEPDVSAPEIVPLDSASVEPATPVDKSAKYKNSPLTEDLSAAFLEELQELMASQKPYLDPKLSLPTLSSMLGIQLSYLSQIINQQSGQNFFDFVNRYRINDAKQDLSKHSKKANILNIAMDVGFNSKSAFYNAFRKHTGQTPTEYRNQLQKTQGAA